MVDYLKRSIIGQISNLALGKKLAHNWYQYALPKESKFRQPFRKKALHSLRHGGCFCLSSLVQGLSKEAHKLLQVDQPPVSLIWGGKGFTHRYTAKESILTHAKQCEIIEFEQCGHFPELESSQRFVRLVQERVN